MKQLNSFIPLFLAVLILSTSVFFQGCQKDSIQPATPNSTSTLTAQHRQQASITSGSIQLADAGEILPNLTGRYFIEVTTSANGESLYKLILEVINVGRTNSGSFTISLTPDSPNASPMNIYVGNLSYKEIKRFEYSPKNQPQQNERTTIFIDDNNSIVESNEKDNTSVISWNQERAWIWINDWLIR